MQVAREVHTNQIGKMGSKKCEKSRRTYTTNLSSERLGRMRLTATGVPLQEALTISPKDPYIYQLIKNELEGKICKC